MGLIFTLSGITLLYGGVSIYKKSRQLGYSSCGHIPSQDVDVDEPAPVPEPVAGAVASLTLKPDPQPEPIAYLQTLSSLFRDVKYD